MSTFPCRRCPLLLLLIACVTGAGGEARASNILWVGNSSNAFGTAGNWSGTNTPPIGGDSLVFGAAGTSGLLLNNNLTSAAFNIAGITFNAGAGAFVIGNGTASANAGNAFNLSGDVLNSSTSLQTINNPLSLSGTRTFTTNAGGGNITLGGVLDGPAGGLLVAGGGILTLTSANSFARGTSVNSGATLQIGNGTGAGSGTGSITGTVANSGALVFNRSADASYPGLSIGGTGGVTVNLGVVRLDTAQSYSGPTQIGATAALVLGADSTFLSVINVDFVSPNSGALDLGNHKQAISGLTGGGKVYSFPASSSAGSLTVTTAAGQTYSFSGSIGDFAPNFSFTKSGPGTQIFTGSATYTGGTTISAGTLQMGDGSNSPNGTGSLGGTISNSGNLVFDRAADYSFGGNISGSGTVAVNVGVLRFSASQSYTGPTVINNGSALVGTVDSALSSGSVVNVASANSRLDLSNHLQTIAGLTGSGRVYSFDSLGGNAGHLTVNVAAGQLFTFSGPVGDIAPKFALIKSGSGTQVFTGATTYTGTTTVGQGTLQFGTGASLNTSPTNTVAVSAGATLAVNYGGAAEATESQVTALLGKATFSGAAAFAFDTTNATGATTYGGALAMAGGLSKVGPGTLVLAGANSYGGATVIREGTLQANSALPTSSAITNDGTLILNAPGASTLAGAIGGVGGVVQQGSGTTILSGPNNYTGATSITGGTLQSASNAALSGTSAISVTNAGSTLAVNYGGSADYTAAQVAAVLSKTTFGATTTAFAFDTTNASTAATYGNPLIMSAGLTKLGAGTLVLAAPNTYSGTTTVLGGTLVLTGANNSAGTVLAGGTLQVGNGGTTGSLGPAAAITNNSVVTFNRSDTVTQGVDFGNSIGGPGKVIQQGSGRLILSGSNPYLGGTIVNAGVLQVGDGIHPTALNGLGSNPEIITGQNAVVVNNGASLESLAFTSLAGGGGGVGGAGGAAVILNGAATFTNRGTVTGGKGGDSFGAAGGDGGAGVLAQTGGMVVNTGTITGGSEGSSDAIGGSGQAGVFFSTGGGSLSNSGTIVGGLQSSGGRGAPASNVTAVVFRSGAATLVNQAGGVIGGVQSDTYANSVMLESGSQINGILYVPGSTTLTLTGAGDQLYSQAVTGATTFDGTLIKQGAGTWTLDQGLSNSGPTQVNTGTLRLTGTLLYTAVTVASGATLAGEGGIGAAGSLTMSGGSILKVAGGTMGALTVSGNLTLSGTVSVVPETLPSGVGAGRTFRLLNYGGTLTGSIANLAMPGFRNSVISNIPAGQINVTYDTQALTWSGGTAAWDVNTTANWNLGADKFYHGDAVTFDDSGAVKAVGLSANVTADSVTFSGGAGYTLGGTGSVSGSVKHTGAGAVTIGVPINGAGSLLNSGAGLLTLTAQNTYTGPTTITQGSTLQLGLGGTTGSLSPASAITNNGTLILNRSNTVAQGTDFSSISGAGAILLQGGVTLVLNNTNNYFGSLTVTSGSVLQVGTGGAFGSVSASIDNHGSLLFKRSDDYSYPDVISGDGAFSSSGYILRLPSRQFITGPTQINTGTLVLSTLEPEGLSGGLPNPTVVTLAAGASLDLSNQNQTVGGLEGGGIVYSFQASSGMLTLDVATGTTHVFSGKIGGTYPGFGLNKIGSGRQALTGTNSYSGVTTVSAGRLEVDGSIAASSGLSVSIGGTLSGDGRVSALSGAGLVAPGSGEILTGTKVDPSGGLDFAFKFALAGAPNYGNAAASGNDLLHLTDAAPFVLSLTAANAITVDFSGATLVLGQTYQGGFFVDAAVPNSTLGGASFSFTGMNGLSAQYDGLVTVPSAAFATGSVAGGRVMQFTIVPEPGTASLAALAAFVFLLRRPRRDVRDATA